MKGKDYKGLKKNKDNKFVLFENKSARKRVSKEFAINNPNKYASLTRDVQAVNLAPFIRASSMYYKTKLCVHNFTVFNLIYFLSNLRFLNCLISDILNG